MSKIIISKSLPSKKKIKIKDRSNNSNSINSSLEYYIFFGIIVICFFGIVTLTLENKQAITHNNDNRNSRNYNNKNSNNENINNINTNNNISKNRKDLSIQKEIDKTNSIIENKNINYKIVNDYINTSINEPKNIINYATSKLTKALNNIKEVKTSINNWNTYDKNNLINQALNVGSKSTFSNIGKSTFTNTDAIKKFHDHPFHKYSLTNNLTDYMKYLSKNNECLNSPIFVTMAQVQDDLYWQLIENYFYTMLTFNHLNCAVMICVSDPLCIERCSKYGFPCYPYFHEKKDDHIMVQVAELKLIHVGRALTEGINVFLLDLDVGFIRDPALLYKGFFENENEQIRAQMDVGTGTDKKTNTWMTSPRPNFGVFLVKSHPLTIKVFENAYHKYYIKSTEENKKRVATDQNSIKNSITHAVWRWGFNFSYFSIGFDLSTKPRPVLDDKVLLLDYVSLTNHNGIKFELGGEISRNELGDAVAVHATCHEGSTKLQGLKAANVFYNNDYYNPMRRTITKPLMLLSKRTLRSELMALAYLATKTNRTLIVPNILIGVGSNIKGTLTKDQCQGLSTPYCFEVNQQQNYFAFQDQSHTAFHAGEYYYPAWRTLKQNLPNLNVIEPAYYYRIQNDYNLSIPEPYVHRFNLNFKQKFNLDLPSSLDQLLLNISNIDEPRLVIDLFDDTLGNDYRGGPDDIFSWASDSVSSWGNGVVKKYGYLPLPLPASDYGKNIQQDFDICYHFLQFVKGNRSCFMKCG